MFNRTWYTFMERQTFAVAAAIIEADLALDSESIIDGLLKEESSVVQEIIREALADMIQEFLCRAEPVKEEEEERYDVS